MLDVNVKKIFDQIDENKLITCKNKKTRKRIVSMKNNNKLQAAFE